jgi:hypothetical protein
MAHYAFINDNNIVTEVIVGRNETEVVDGITDWEAHYATYRPGQRCVRTSYNNNIRKNYAGIGYTYDTNRDAFIPPQPYPSWTLMEETCLWGAPTPMPVVEGKLFTWDEDTVAWIESV